MPKIAKAMSAGQLARITKPGLHSVGGVPGLQLQVTPTGGRSWVLRVKVGDKRRDFGLGSCGDVTLAQAREDAREAKAKIRQGIDPKAERKALRDALIADQAKAVTFAEAARRCHAVRASEFRNVKHRADWLSSLERYVFPTLGHMLVSDIEMAHVQQALMPIWKEKTETATRIRQRIESVLSWATVSGFRSGDNPARWADNLKEVMPKPSKIRKKGHFPALPFTEVPAFLVELRKREGTSVPALEFAILNASRSGEVRGMTWGEVDMDAALWTIPAERMKAENAHEVPLSDAAIAILRNQPRSKGQNLVFPALKGGQMSDMTLSAVCRRMECGVVPHGFRSSFKEWVRKEAHDNKGRRFADEVSELQLAHVNSDATRAAYARDGLLSQRRELLQAWARFCNPTSAANVTPIKRAAP